MSGADSTDGSSEYRYSNLSYIILGMVIEAVSGETYEAFCQSRIFSPLQIAAQIAPDLRRVAPFAGWAISAPDMLRVWTVFDIDHPSLLTRETLEATLFSRDLPPIAANSHTYYTLGTLVTQDADKSGYALRHDGIVDFLPSRPSFYTLVEKRIPGFGWIFVYKKLPFVRGPDRQDFTAAVREVVQRHEGVDAGR